MLYWAISKVFGEHDNFIILDLERIKQNKGW